MIPLTVIGGFLGAGKTTLLNHLLASADRRWGVLVNDFGAINIDAGLIRSGAGDLMTLTNGCVCCAMGDDLGSALARLSGRVPAIEHVIVETSGVADPWRTAQLALIEPGYALEPIVVVADAAALDSHLADRWVADTVRGQIAAAELVVINKSDLDDPARAAATVRSIRPDAVLLPARNAVVPPEALRFIPPARAALRTAFRADTAPGHGFRTWHWTPPGAFDRAALRATLRRLPASVLRVKGFCRLDDDPAPFLLQFAAGEWALSPLAIRPTGSDPTEPETHGPTMNPITATHPGRGRHAPALVAIGTPAMPDPAALTTLFEAAIRR